MAEIETSVLRIGSNDLVLQDGAARGSLANAYSASSTYAVGDYVLYGGQLYECNTAISTAEAWTAAHWTAVTVGGELSTVKDGLSGLAEDGLLYAPFQQILNKGFNVNTGATPYEANWDISSLIPVKEGEIIHISNGRSTAYNGFYKSDGTYITGSNFTVPASSDFAKEVPTNAAYMRITNGHAYFDFKVWREIEGLATGKDFRSLKGLVNDMAFDRLNLCDFYALNTGKYINISNGNLVSEDGNSYADYFRVKESTDYCIASWNGSQYARLGAGYLIAYYDGEKNFISGEGVSASTKTTSPAKASFARFSLSTGLVTTSRQLMFIEDSALSSLTIESYVPCRSEIKTLGDLNRCGEEYIVVRNPYCELQYPDMYVRFDSLGFYHNSIHKNVSFNYSDIVSRYPDNYKAYNYAKVHHVIWINAATDMVVLNKDTMKVDIINQSYMFLNPEKYLLLCAYDVGADAMYGAIAEQFALDNDELYNRSRYESIKNSTLLALNNRLNAISSAYTDDNFVFAWLSDNHLPPVFGVREADMTDMAIAISDKSVNFNAIINTGDSVMELSGFNGMNALRKVGEKINTNKLVYCQGNHDRNIISPIISKQNFYNTIYRQTIDENIHWGNKLDSYFYRDYPNHKIRIVVLNVYEFFNDMDNDTVDPTKVGYSNTQLNWLANTALVVDSDWHVIIVTHDAPVALDHNGADIQHNKQSLIDILQSFKNGTSTTITYTDSTYPELFSINVTTHFTSAGNIIALLAGHAHYDDADKVNGINYIQINCAYMDVTNEFSGFRDRTMYELSSVLFDIGVVDKTNRTLVLKRVGYGSDRNFTY